MQLDRIDFLDGNKSLKLLKDRSTCSIAKQKNQKRMRVGKMTHNQTLGNTIKQSRKAKNYSQRELAKLVEIDFTYLSKIENDRTDYPPKEQVLRAIARQLDIDEDELIFLSGRIPQDNKEFVKQHYDKMPVLFRRLRENPEQFKKMLDESDR